MSSNEIILTPRKLYPTNITAHMKFLTDKEKKKTHTQKAVHNPLTIACSILLSIATVLPPLKIEK